MKAASVTRGLTGPPRGVILDEQGSVSGPTPDARPGSSEDQGLEETPLAVEEVT